MENLRHFIWILEGWKSEYCDYAGIGVVGISDRGIDIIHSSNSEHMLAVF